jgi:Protein of unknown function (DUF3667)
MAELEDRACVNCGAVRTGRFCSCCGQDSARLELSLRGKLAELVDAAAGIDSRVARTIVALGRDPGGFARAWVGGRRMSYVTPLRFLLGTCAAWFAARSLALRMWERESVSTAGQPEQPVHAAQELMQSYGQVLNLVAVPLLTPVLGIAFAGARTPYLAHASLLAFAFGQVFLFRSVLELLVAAFPGLQVAANAAEQLGQLAYWVWAIHGYHRRDFARPLARATLAMLMLLVANIVLNLAFVRSWIALR